MMNPIRRAVFAFGIAAAATALLFTSTSAQAAYPDRPIKLIVPFAPGGSNDILARVLAEKLGGRLGQPIIVENRAGAGGTIGTEFVVKAPPDGYTLLFASTSITTNAASGKKLPYDLVKDLQPIGYIAEGIHRSRAREARQHHIRHGRHWRHQSPRDRAFRLGGQHQARARALQGYRTGVHRPYGWQFADGAPHGVLGRRVYPFGKDACARSHRRTALAART